MHGGVLDTFHSTLVLDASFATALWRKYVVETAQTVSANCGYSFIISAIIYNSILALYYKNK
jgi:hypothetical protein